MQRGKEIVVRVFDDGRIEVEAVGYKGEGCKDATKFIEDALGDATDVEEKAEWWVKNGREVRKTRERRGLETDKFCG